MMTKTYFPQNRDFWNGYRDALLGEDFIKEDQSMSYYQGVREVKLEQLFWED